MATITHFEDLEAWKLARELTREVYRVTSDGRFARDFALVNQIRKAAVSGMGTRSFVISCISERARLVR